MKLRFGKMETLPLEILVHIASVGHTVWRGLLVVRLFAEYTMSRCSRSFVLRRFCEIRHIMKKSFSTTELIVQTLLCGKKNSFFDYPAVVRTTHLKCVIPIRKMSNFETLKKWYRAGHLHREDDLPAVISKAYCEFYKYGELFRSWGFPTVITGIECEEYNKPREKIPMCRPSKIVWVEKRKKDLTWFYAYQQHKYAAMRCAEINAQEAETGRIKDKILQMMLPLTPVEIISHSIYIARTDRVIRIAEILGSIKIKCSPRFLKWLAADSKINGLQKIKSLFRPF